MPISRNPELTSYAQKLRREATKEERHLWYDFLKTYDLRFQRQRTIGPYIVDFYCSKAKLVIELDGSQHYEDGALAYDARRTEYMQGQGLRVLRFTNTEVLGQFDAVCTAIDHAVKEAIS